MLGLGGGREVIGLQVAPAGTEDPEEKPEVCHLTGGDPSVRARWTPHHQGSSSQAGHEDQTGQLVFTSAQGV